MASSCQALMSKSCVAVSITQFCITRQKSLLISLEVHPNCLLAHRSDSLSIISEQGLSRVRGVREIRGRL